MLFQEYILYDMNIVLIRANMFIKNIIYKNLHYRTTTTNIVAAGATSHVIVHS